MGADGGCVAVKRKFLRGAGSLAEKKAAAHGWMFQRARNDVAETGLSDREKSILRCRTCALSGELLREPVVADELGSLLNKDVLLTAMLEHRLPKAFEHVRGLKDVVQCKFVLADKPEEGGGAAARAADEAGAVRFACPITQTELSGTTPFVVVWTTGHVLSSAAVKAVGISALQAEYGPFVDSDLVGIAPADADLGAVAETMHARRARSKEAKKAAKKGAKKRKRLAAGAAAPEAGASPDAGAKASSSSSSSSSSSAGTAAAASSSAAAGSSAAAATAAATKPPSAAAAAAAPRAPKRNKFVASGKATAAPAPTLGGGGSVLAASIHAAREMRGHSAVYAGLFTKPSTDNKPGKNAARDLLSVGTYCEKM